jgi:uncharacterized protein YndB with AHSA1/START domain
MNVINEAAQGETLVLTREFAAPRALLFKVWTQPEHIVRWWGCSEVDGCQTKFTNNLRVGGEFSAEMSLGDGDVHRIWGVYCKIEEPERLVFTWSWENSRGFEGEETLVTLTFEETAGGTRLTLKHEKFATADDRDSHGDGWTASLDRLAELLAEL